MNGGQDLGGTDGLGPVVDEAPSPANPMGVVWHADWEPRVMAMVVALGACGRWNIDRSRHSRESMAPHRYMASPYYGIWYEGVTKLLSAEGMVRGDELTEGRPRVPPVPVKGMMAAADVWPALHSLAGRADRPAGNSEPAFAGGARVTTINEHPAGHTRLPRYARGRTGTVEAVIGHHLFADAAAHGANEAHWLYRIAFAATDLFGRRAHEGDIVTLDLWEPHLVAA